DATRDKILDALRWVAAEAGPNDPVFIGFFGAAGLIGKDESKRCYLAYDSTLDNKDKDGVAAVEVADALKDLKSQRLVGFVDIELVGTKGNPRVVIESLLDKDTFKEFLGDEGADHNPKRGRVLFVKTNYLTRSLDLKDHSLFGQVLLDGLTDKADVEGGEPDG